MTYTLPLTTMSVSEKIQMMETLWENLTQQSQDITSPTWHQDLLLQREKLLEINRIILLIGTRQKNKSSIKFDENRDPQQRPARFTRRLYVLRKTSRKLGLLFSRLAVFRH